MTHDKANSGSQSDVQINRNSPQEKGENQEVKVDNKDNARGTTEYHMGKSGKVGTGKSRTELVDNPDERRKDSAHSVINDDAIADPYPKTRHHDRSQDK